MAYDLIVTFVERFAGFVNHRDSLELLVYGFDLGSMESFGTYMALCLSILDFGLLALAFVTGSKQ